MVMVAIGKQNEKLRIREQRSNLQGMSDAKFYMAEYRISIYGRKQSEWDQLASWIVNNDLYSENVVWLIQLPRLYNIYKEMGIVTSFQNILDNIFIPLFEVTIDPDSHPQLHVFLKQVVGLDLVDDESKPERRPTKHMPTPTQWTNLRESKGMTTIKFRPHSGESHWIGKEYYKRGPAGNDIHRTNVPHIRVEFRDAIWRDEMQQVYLGKAVIPKEVDK
ncbi:hypothetical protein NC652_036928 [Populus alba x Populus x berolinensis]|nr:hypothetical protein NC652_036928 [Populus alba x Populus x berolinensis]